MKPSLPTLDAHRRDRTYCTYCPKLCRHAYPVSTAQGSETTTPWAKMTSLEYVAEGRLDCEQSVSESWYGCTGCLRCNAHCDHQNEVADALFAGRNVALENGSAPVSLDDLRARHRRRSERAAAIGDERFSETSDKAASTSFVPGCTALAIRPQSASNAHRVVKHLLGAEVAVKTEHCCGLPLFEMGDIEGFKSAAEAFLNQFSGNDEVVFQDPGCLHAMTKHAAKLGIVSNAALVHLTQFVDRHHDKLKAIENTAPIRYHDPCRLGRGLGVYDEPRRVLETLVGSAVEEFYHRRDDAICAGAGGQLPFTDPSTAEQIAVDRHEEHRLLGGGVIVTACAGAAHQLEKSGASVQLFSDIVLEGLR